MHKSGSFLILAGLLFALLCFDNLLIAQNRTFVNSDLQDAKWIGAGNQIAFPDSLLYGDHPAPLFRKDFQVQKGLISAQLSITAAGYYLILINGKRLENNILDPAWTNFSKRVYYSNYDITSLIKKGTNVVGIILGNGFYNSLPLRMFGKFNFREFLPTGQPQFIARMRFDYSDGSSKEIVSDTSWKTSPSPILKNNIYLGELYDSRKEIDGWDRPGFDDRRWTNSELKAGPGGEIQSSFFPGVTISRRINPAEIWGSSKGTIIDLGVNLTGVFKIHMFGDTGDTVTFRFGERLYENGLLNPMTTVAGQIKRKGSGGPGAPDVAWQTDRYIFGAKSEVDYQPDFTFHTFRYMEIQGLKYVPQKRDIEAIEFHSNVENQNNFNCSSALINKIQKACVQTFLNNLISVQSDCPAREKLGYGGDLNATSEAFINNFNMQSFYRKTIYDWVDAIQDSIFIDTAPFVGIAYCGISWESAFLTTQDKLLQYYGDTAIINELYKCDLDWMDKVRRLYPEEIVDKGLSDHEAIVKVPVQLIGSTHYLECARIMKRFARIKGDMAAFNRFDSLEKSLTWKLLDLYWRNPTKNPINRQTIFATLIYYQLIPANEIQAAADSLLKAVRNSPAGHFTTGIFGTKYILEALSMTGHTDEVFKIVESTEFPGWGHMMDRGATTLWESWKESDNTYSNCHPMFGSVSEWYYRWIAGIRPSIEFPGFKKFILAPNFLAGLNFVNAVYNTPYGDIKVEWKRNTEGNIELKVDVPNGTSAEFFTTGKAQKTWNVTNVNTKVTVLYDATSSSMELPGGEYSIK